LVVEAERVLVMV
jgi:hypothetical protein